MDFVAKKVTESKILQYLFQTALLQIIVSGNCSFYNFLFRTTAFSRILYRTTFLHIFVMFWDTFCVQCVGVDHFVDKTTKSNHKATTNLSINYFCITNFCGLISPDERRVVFNLTFSPEEIPSNFVVISIIMHKSHLTLKMFLNCNPTIYVSILDKGKMYDKR